VPPLLIAALLAAPPEPFLLADNDRVALVGGTLVEREQQTGTWETLVTLRTPAKNVTFRNLGWSGDTVFGDARAGFGSQPDGFRKLVEQVKAVKPTVLVLAYGTNEAFAGSAGLSRFKQGLAALLDALAPLKCRTVLAAPPPMEAAGKPLPNPATYNAALPAYRDAIRDTAVSRRHAFIDFGELFRPTPGLTDNGLHPTPAGYWRSADAVAAALGAPGRPWRLKLSARGFADTRTGPVLSVVSRPMRYEVTDLMLPPPPPPAGTKVDAPPRVLTVTDLPPGRYALTIDGQRVASADAAGWAAGVALERGPDFEQAEKLRRTVVAKNLLYFHRYRPQNETYLFGFRKHEQGQNAAEVPQFEPLVAAKEAEIQRLRTPVARTYVLTPEAGQ
jgi:lysophospholipase L1-like esterase